MFYGELNQAGNGAGGWGGVTVIRRHTLQSMTEEDLPGR